MSLSNAQFDAVMRHYDEIREQKRHEQNARTEEVYGAIPEILHLDDEIAARSMDAAKARIADPGADLSGYRSSMQRIAARKKELLLAHGYPEDYLELQYECPVCRDTGFADGRRCACFERAAAEIVYGKYGLKKVLDRENFGSFSFEWYSDTIVDASTGKTPLDCAKNGWEAAHRLLDSLDEPDQNLYIYGNTGTGKTFLSHCIARDALDLGHSVLYFSAGEFFDVLAGTVFGHSGDQHAGSDLIRTVDLLIIDDLGTEVTNSFTSSELFRVINSRITDSRSTVISTNLALKDMATKYSERIFSRVTSHYSIVKLTGDDIRIRMKLAEAKT